MTTLRIIMLAATVLTLTACSFAASISTPHLTKQSTPTSTH